VSRSDLSSHAAFLSDGQALVKLVSPAELLKARDEKRAIAEAKAAKKAAQVAEEKRKREAKLQKGRVPPQEFFRPPNVEEGKYGSWDEKGLPLTDNEGKELSKNQVKANAKTWAAQEKAHTEYLKWKEAGSV
jgi:cysteinyl-tRNA synthetase